MAIDCTAQSTHEVVGTDIDTYIWTVDPVFTIVSGQGTDTLAIESTSSTEVTGNITCEGSNSAGTSSMTVSVTHEHVDASAGIKLVGSTGTSINGNANDITVPLNTLTGGLDTLPSEGDIVVVFTSHSNGSAYSMHVPTGYTMVTQGSSDAVRQCTSTLSYKIMGAVPDTSLVIPDGSRTQYLSGTVHILVFKGVDLTTPFGAASTITKLDSILAQAPTITPTVPGSIMLVGGSGGHVSSYGQFYEPVDNVLMYTTRLGNDSTDVIGGFGYYEWAGGTFTPLEYVCQLADNTSYGSVGLSTYMNPQL